MRLSRTAKNKKSDSDEWQFYSFGIPAGKSAEGFVTCPGMGECGHGCYAKQGNYVMPNTKNIRETNLEATRSKMFVPAMNQLLFEKTKGKPLSIRIHDDGDFYNKVYLKKWYKIMDKNPDTRFYAYTKMIPLFLDKEQPENFTLIYSFGGKWDNLIDPKRHRHSRVFRTRASIKKHGYVDASDNDEIAVTDPSIRIGLVYHGNHYGKEWGIQ